MTILVVDDEAVVRMVVRTVLVREGYTVLEATTREEAVTVADAYSSPIHLLITNHLIQNTSGREIAEELRETRPDMKVMHISGHLLKTIEQQDGFTPGAAFLQKPFLPKQLADAVRLLLG